MFLKRVIPILLVNGAGLIKTRQFKDWKYLGDVINAIRIFNEKEVDEIIVLDINATTNRQSPRYDLIRDITSEAFMPFCYGGGIRTIREIGKILSLGTEKVSINSTLFEDLNLIKEAALQFGSQSIVASLDIRTGLNGKWKLCSHRGTKLHDENPIDFAKKIQDMGVGEILLCDIDREGTRSGYNLELIQEITEQVEIPVIACGGASDLIDFKRAMDAGASAVAASHLFTLIGRLNAPLLSYPSIATMEELFKKTEMV